MTLLDEASTCILGKYDKTSRFGASVHLAGEIVSEAGIDASSNLAVRTIPRRIGKTLAFADVEIFADDAILLRGTHVKFMPGGFVLDAVGRPELRPVVRWYFDNVVSRWRVNVADRDFGSFDDVFALEDVVVDDVTARAALAVGRDHCNPVGALHGGATCFLAERLSTQVCADLVPTSMRVNLMAASKPGDTVKVEARVLDDRPSAGTTTVAAGITASNGTPTVDAIVRFEDRRVSSRGPS